MPLFFVEHKHTIEACPTQKPEMMMMLGKHVSEPNAATYGIRVLADIVHPGEHRMNMVLEADSQEPIDKFMQPFGMVGSVDVKQVSTCEQVVATGKC